VEAAAGILGFTKHCLACLAQRSRTEKGLLGEMVQMREPPKPASLAKPFDISLAFGSGPGPACLRQ